MSDTDKTKNEVMWKSEPTQEERILLACKKLNKRIDDYARLFDKFADQTLTMAGILSDMYEILNGKVMKVLELHNDQIRELLDYIHSDDDFEEEEDQ